MNWTTLQGNWNETKGKVKTKWGRLTDDDLTQVQGQKDRLVGVIQQKYGIAREKAEEQLDEFLSSADSFVSRAKETAQDAVGKVKETAHDVVERGREYVDQGRDYVERNVREGRDYVQNTSVSDMGRDLRDLIARNPVQSAILGIGLGFLIGRLLTPSNRS
jgi:uncharacterized protein YjbJ (UPF0337 family)